MTKLKQLRQSIKQQYGQLGELCQAVLTYYEENDPAGMSNRLLKELTAALNTTAAIAEKRPETIQQQVIDKEKCLAYIQYCMELDKTYFTATGWPPADKEWPGYVEGQTLEQYLLALEDQLNADMRQFEDCLLVGMEVPDTNNMLDLERYGWHFYPTTNPLPEGGEEDDGTE